MSTLVEQLLLKLGLLHEPNVLEKTTELLRLLEVRSANVPLQFNDSAKVVLCADIAATLLGVNCDREIALKASSLRKSQYANYKRMLEKLLDMHKIVGVQDICVQLSMTEVAPKAKELLHLYQQVLASEQTDADIAHPQYAAMATYQACKLLKRKCTKTKIMYYSNLRPTQWQQLELRWDKFLNKHYKTIKENATANASNEANAHTTHTNKSSETKSATTAKPTIEDYEAWKQRMLSLAEQQLRIEKSSNKT